MHHFCNPRWRSLCHPIFSHQKLPPSQMLMCSDVISLAVHAVDTFQYQAAVVQSLTCGLQHDYWQHSTDPCAQLFRLVNSIKWPTMKRTKLQGRHNLASGTCIGLTQGQGPPYVHLPTRRHGDLVRLVTSMVHSFDPSFRYSALQTGIDSRAALHIDPNNVGPSYVIALGPYTGGVLWQLS